MEVKTKEIQLPEMLLHRLEAYFNMSLKHVHFRYDEQLIHNGVVAYLKGTDIFLHPQFTFLPVELQRHVLVHEVAHISQSVQNVANKEMIFGEYIPYEMDANRQAMLFCMQYENIDTYMEGRKDQREVCDQLLLTGWNGTRMEYGLGGIFTWKQVLSDGLGKSKKLSIDYVGYHEFLTEQAWESVKKTLAAENATNPILPELEKKDNRKSLVIGSQVNDLYFFQEFYVHMANSLLTQEQIETFAKNEEDHLEKSNDTLNRLDTADSFGEKYRILRSYIITDDYVNAVMHEIGKLFGEYIRGKLNSLILGMKAEDVKNILYEILSTDLNTGLAFISVYLDKVKDCGEALLMYMNDHELPDTLYHLIIDQIKDFMKWIKTPKSEKLTDIEHGICKAIQAMTKIIDMIENSFQDICDELGRKLERDVCEGSEIDKFVRKQIQGYRDICKSCEYVYCIAQFLMYSHTKDMQFLHSMDCSKGDILFNTEKCMEWANFCIDVYWNRPYKGKKLLEWNLKDYLINRYVDDNKDMLVQMLMPLMIKISYAMHYEETASNMAKTNSLSERDRLIQQTKLIRERLEQADKENDSLVFSFFANRTIGEFFNMMGEDHPGCVALGMASHMIEDSFTASHTIRPWNIHNGEPLGNLCEERFDHIKDILPPVMYYADYTKQNASRHTYADIFVDTRQMESDATGCKHCDQLYGVMTMAIQEPVCEDNPDLYMQDRKHNCHRTMGAVMATESAAQYLYLTLSMPKEEKSRLARRKKINTVLRDIYSSFNDTDYYLAFLQENISVQGACMDKINLKFFEQYNLKAGRSFENEENIQYPKIKHPEESILDVLYKETIRLKESVQGYREYLINTFGRCMIPTEGYIMERCKKDRLNISNPNLKYASYAKRIIFLYEKMDLPKIIEILDCCNRILVSKERVLEGHMDYEEKITKLYEQIKRTKEQYLGHLYEIFMNLLWMKQQAEQNGHVDYKEDIARAYESISNILKKYKEQEKNSHDEVCV